MLPATTYYLISNGASEMTPVMFISAVAVGLILVGALIGFANRFLNR